MQKQLILGIIGCKQSEKDAVSNYLQSDYNFTKLAFATSLKNICKEIFDLTDDQLNGKNKDIVDSYWNIEPRKILQYVGTELFREKLGELIPQIGKNIWIKKIQKTIESCPSICFVITDVRFQNEIDMIHAINGKIIYVIKPLYDNTILSQHILESGIDNLKNIDFIVYNDSSLSQLFIKIDKIVMNLID